MGPSCRASSFSARERKAAEAGSAVAIRERPRLEGRDQVRPELERVTLESAGGGGETGTGVRVTGMASVAPFRRTVRSLLAATRMETVAKEALSVASATMARTWLTPSSPTSRRRISLPSP
jgi:hypothetical protein